MSDASQGEGWWMASNGKWYPPAEPMLVTPEPMLVTPEQESADADTLVAELDRAIRSVADLTEATLTGHARRWPRSPKSGSEAPESRSGPVGDRDTDTRWGPTPDSHPTTAQRPTITSRLRAKLRGF